MIQRILSWLGERELAVLLAIVTVAAGAWGFVGIAEEVLEGDTESVDRALLLAIPRGSPALDEAARDLTALGGVAVLSLLTAIVTGLFALSGKRRLALFVFGSIVTGVLLSTALKEVFDRPRPDLVQHGSYVVTASFPSGHSMMSAVVYLTLGALLARSEKRRRLKAYFLLVAVALTICIGVSRVYLGVHWPTDVLAGWTAGAVWAALCSILTRYLQRSRTVEPETSASPGL